MRVRVWGLGLWAQGLRFFRGFGLGITKPFTPKQPLDLALTLHTRHASVGSVTARLLALLEVLFDRSRPARSEGFTGIYREP